MGNSKYNTNHLKLMDTLQGLNRGLKTDLENDTLHFICTNIHDMHIIFDNHLGTKIHFNQIREMMFFA